MTSPAAPDRLPAAVTADGAGIMLGGGPVTVDAYIDYLCPFCRRFENFSGSALDAMVSGGQISLVYHPMSFLDAAATNRYSSRAGAASGCASDGGKFREYSVALFAAQPPEGGPGLSDAELAELGMSVGLTDEAFASAVLGGRYLDWPPFVTGRATVRGVTATPAVLVGGEPVEPDPLAITVAVASG
jgi:protein-disulfide isomerase